MKSILLTLLFSFFTLGGFAQNVKVQTLGRVAALVKVDPSKKYVLIPIQETAPESNLRIVVDNKTVATPRAHLAVDKIDYYVPMDVSAYKGHNVLLYVQVLADRNTFTHVDESVWPKNIKMSDTFDTTNREKFRPAFHHTPEYGWMNDPNGQFYKDGVWHLYYQYNAYGSVWGNMSWAHSTSKDLIHWNHEPLAVDANGLGTVFSGSCVVDKNNTAGYGKDAVVGFFTSADVGYTESQMQSMVYSKDGGKTFDFYPANPVIASNNECRDPNLFWNEDTKEWNLYLVSALTHEVWFYASKDLKNWTKTGAFGGYGCKDGVWECPDLMKLPVRGKKGEYKWILIVNINPGGPYGGSATQYFVGNWDGKTFTCEDAPEVTKWMDYGKDHYATVSWANQPEGRTAVIAWMSNWQYAGVVPTKQFRSANSLPRDLDIYQGDDKSYYVGVNPSRECSALRGELITQNPKSKTQPAPVPGAIAPVLQNLPSDGLCEILLDLSTASKQNVNITLSNTKGEKVVMTYNTAEQTFAMDRTNSGIVNFSQDFPCITKCPIQKGKKQTLRLFIDRCSIEAFEGTGKWAMTNLVFPNEPYTQISVDGKVNSLKVYSIKK